MDSRMVKLAHAVEAVYDHWDDDEAEDRHGHRHVDIDLMIAMKEAYDDWFLALPEAERMAIINARGDRKAG